MACFCLLTFLSTSAQAAGPVLFRVGNLEVAGPLPTATSLKAGDRFAAGVMVKNYGFKAPFEARLEIKSPNGDIVYTSRDAAGAPGRRFRLERNAATTFTCFLDAPAQIGTYTYRLRVRNVYMNVWQLREPAGELWGPLFEVTAGPRRPGEENSDTVLVPLPPQVQAGNNMQFQLRGSGLSGLISGADGGARLRVVAMSPDLKALPAFLVEQANPDMIQFRGTIPADAMAGKYLAGAYNGSKSLIFAPFNVNARPVELANTPPRITSVRASSGGREFTPGATITGESALTVVFKVVAEDSDGIVAWQFDPGSSGSNLENVVGPTGIGAQTLTVTRVFEPGNYSPSIRVKDGSHEDKDFVSVVEKENFFRIEVTAPVKVESAPPVRVTPETTVRVETGPPANSEVPVGVGAIVVTPSPVLAGQIVTFHLTGRVPTTAPGPEFGQGALGSRANARAAQEHERRKRAYFLTVVRISGLDSMVLRVGGVGTDGVTGHADLERDSTTVNITLPDSSPGGTYKAVCIFPEAFAGEVSFEVVGKPQVRTETSVRVETGLPVRTETSVRVETGLPVTTETSVRVETGLPVTTETTVRVETTTPTTPLTPSTPPIDTLAPPAPTGDIRAAVSSLTSAYQSKDASSIMAMVAADYHGVTEGSGNLDRSLLARSLSFDFAQIDAITLTSNVDRVEQGADISIVVLSWSVKYTHIATGAPIEEVNRLTSLSFRSTSSSTTGWMLVGQTGSPLLGRSDAITGLFTPPPVLAAIEQKRLADEAARRAQLLAGTTPVDTTPKIVFWSADDFVKNVQTATTAMITAYQNKDAAALMAYVSKDYRGVNSIGGTADYFSLPLSLQGDFQIFNNFRYSAATEVFRVYATSKQAEVILIWDAYARYLASNEDIIERSRRTRLVFVDEAGVARLLNQDIATVTNGTVMFGQADAGTGVATVRADVGSTSPVGTVVAVSSSAGTTSSTTVTLVDSASLSGTISANRTISINSTIDGDVTIPSGVTLTIASGVTLTVTGNFKVDVFGTLDGTNCTIRSSSGSPGSWQGLRFLSGSTALGTNVTIRDAAVGAYFAGGNPSGGGTVTLTNNVVGVEVASGSPNISSAIISNNTGIGVKVTGGNVTLSGNTIQSNNVGINISSGATVTTTGISVTNSTSGGAVVAGTLNANTGSSFSDNNQDGVTMAAGGTLNASGASFNGNGRDGVNLQAGGTLNATSASNFNSNLAHGIYADLGGGNISITNCNIQSNTDTGVMGNASAGFGAATANGWYMFANHCSSTFDLSTTVPTSIDACPQYGGMTSVSSPKSSPN